jgi:hypothetical protein
VSFRKKSGRKVGKRTPITEEHTLDLLQVLANLFAGLRGGREETRIYKRYFDTNRTGAHLFPRLTWRGRFESEDVVSQATSEIGRGARLCLEKIHGVTTGGGGMRTMAQDTRVRRMKEQL